MRLGPAPVLAVAALLGVASCADHPSSSASPHVTKWFVTDVRLGVLSGCSAVAWAEPIDLNGGVIAEENAVFSAQCVSPPITFPAAASELPHCIAVEVLPNELGQCAPCDPELGRSSARASVGGPVLERLRLTGQCVDSECVLARYCMCELRYAADREKCEQTGSQPDNYGWCFVDPSQGVGNPLLVEDCRLRREVIFTGCDTPAPGATIFLACFVAPTGG